MSPMAPRMTNNNSAEQRLRKLFRELSGEDQKTLLDFAEFLAGRAVSEEGVLPDPLEIPRPESESVVKAIRRLSEAYFMLDKDHMINETSALMAQHIMQGRDAAEVIDDLEQVFARHYQNKLEQQS
jgi:Ca2+-binding EF-hand superfamily protein